MADRERADESLTFEAWEYRLDGGFERVRHAWQGSEARGWRVEREGQPVLAFGPGFRPMRARACGVCSTDLDRHFLPFPLPQVTGHEVVVSDDRGRRFAVEINASHRARGQREACAFCRQGLDTHCPDRRVLGIHDLPGGFGPWVLAATGALVPLPDSLPEDVALLLEPFAAALHAVDTVRPRAGDTVAVLGPRRLGLLVVAALAARRRQHGASFEILALSRHDALLERARRLGATATRRLGPGRDAPAAHVVFDTTGSPEGLLRALDLAEREVHLKSTHGQPAAGLRQATALVVDELRLQRTPTDPPGALRAAALAARPKLAWLSASACPDLAAEAECRRGSDAAALRDVFEAESGPDELPRADVAVVDSLADADRVIRPREDDERALVRPRGAIWLQPTGTPDAGPLATAIRERGLVLSSSRCGDFRRALSLLEADPALHGIARLVTHRMPESRLPEAFATARDADCIKAVIEHEPARSE